MKKFDSLKYRIYFLFYKIIFSLSHPDIFRPNSKKEIINKFHKLFYYSTEVWHKKTTWLGHPALKCPFDLWIYQEIIYELKPDLIIECGTYHGGSALYLASICDLIKKGQIITIDTKQQKDRPSHKRIKYLLGSSVSEETVTMVKKSINKKMNILVILDSDHHKDHVLKELNIYKKFVTKGSYLIVEDTNMDGNPVEDPIFGPGPYEAVKEFLRSNKNFKIDREREKFYLTFSPSGFLKRVN